MITYNCKQKTNKNLLSRKAEGTDPMKPGNPWRQEGAKFRSFTAGR